MADDFLNDVQFWKELGLEIEEPEPEEVEAAELSPEAVPASEPELQEEERAEKPQKLSAGKKRKKPRKDPSVIGVIAEAAVKTVVAVLCIALMVGFVGNIALMSGGAAATSKNGASDVTIMDKFDMFMTNQVSSALDGVLSIKKVYWLSDSDLVAPKPEKSNFGTATKASELNWLLEEAAELIGGQKMIFNENTPVWEEKGIQYYYDETILVITWKQIIDRVVYNMSEVRIAHPSQLRRFLADGEFGSDKLYVTTEMAANVNSVVACSGDFYRFRRFGAVVYEGQLRRFEGYTVDTCFINDEGDLLFAYRGDLTSEEQAKKFVEDNNVRFSLAFGPVAVDNGKACTPSGYGLGEIHDRYARAALCQVDKLHYLLVSACGENNYQNRHNIHTFAKNLEEMGVEKAYTLDGGQTTVIAMDGKLYNDVEFGFQRKISDIIYFATAIPEGG